MIKTIALPLIAVAKKGAEMDKADNGKTRPGRDLDHFRVVFSPEFEHYAQVFERLYGKDPAVLPGLRFLDDKPFSFFYERWGGNQTLQVRHDGQQYIKRWTASGYDYTSAPVEEADLNPKLCQPHGRLVFLLEDFFRETGEVGIFMATTSSEVDRDTIQAYLVVMRMMRIPLDDPNASFILRRVPRDFTVEIKGKPSRVTKYMWHLKATDGAILAALPAQTNPVTGEITGGNRPALSGGPEPRILTRDETVELYEIAKDKGCIKSDLLMALGVSDIAHWLHSDPLNEAVRRLETWLDRAIEIEQEAADLGDLRQPALLGIDESDTAPTNYSEGA